MRLPPPSSRLILLVGLGAMLSGCSSPTDNHRKMVSAVHRDFRGIDNACLPAAIAVSSALWENGIPAEVLAAEWDAYEVGVKKRTRRKPEGGHAFAVFIDPRRPDTAWAYCNDWGSIKLPASVDMSRPEEVALAALWSRGILPVGLRASYEIP